ncbi:MerR family transcriptional regulator [Streptomyces scopuliridis]|uniref:MerR family transcriptional regulator n=1 Tax=Streptomyces scopuliridis TaxID=452529 RepID=UPI003678A016
MNGDALHAIGDLARRTGLTVKTIRFYSDAGIVPPTDRSPAGYRLYDIDAVTPLDLVRTLRDLGLDLSAIRKVLDREVSVPEVASALADALDVQIRTLRLRRSVLRADDPAPEQVEAWVELGELCQDTDFRAAVRRMAEHQAAQRAQGDTTGLHHDLTTAVREQVDEALAAGIHPASDQAAPVVDSLTVLHAETFGRADDADLRRWLVTRLETGADPRAERYWQLLSAINGRPVPPTLTPVFNWFITALRTQLSR